MISKILYSSIAILFLFNLLMVNAQIITNIELFDIEKSKIITIPTNPKIQLEAKKILKDIDGVVKQINPVPERGYMVKIPLTPSLRLENKWVNASIDEVIIIIPKNEKPYLFIFDDDNKTYLFTFKKEIDTLLKALDFPFK